MQRYNVMGIVVGAVVVGLVAWSHAAAAPVTLENGNSWARIWPDSPLGNDIWVVDDWNFLRRQWFWYRLDGPGGVGHEASLETLDPDPTVFPSDTDGDSVDDNVRLTYEGTDLGLAVTVNYNLMGGTPGSFRADLAETVRIANFGNVAQGVHFYEYADFILSAGEDTLRIRYPNTATQWFDAVRVAETVVTPQPGHYEANRVPVILDRLNDGLPTTLADLPGPVTGDVAWAFEWDITLAPGASYLISKDKSYAPTPEPATLTFVGLGLAALLARRRKQ